MSYQKQAQGQWGQKGPCHTGWWCSAGPLLLHTPIPITVAEDLGLHSLNTLWCGEKPLPRGQHTLNPHSERRDAHLTLGRGQTHAKTLLPTGVRVSSCSGRAGSTAGIICRERETPCWQQAEIWGTDERKSRASKSRDWDNQGEEI